MYSSFIGVLKEGVLENLDDYYDAPFDLFTTYYELTGFYKVPSEWRQILGKWKQMDWGCWLSICSNKQVQELFLKKSSPIAKITPATGDETLAHIGKEESPSNLIKADWYGVLEVEDY